MLRIIFIAFSLVFVSTVHAQNSASAVRETNHFVDKENRYQIELPENWVVQKDFMGLDVFAAAPKSNDQEGSLANISVISSDIPSDVSLELYFSENMKELEKDLTDFNVINKSEVDFHGIKGKKISYTHMMNKLKIQVTQYFVIHSNRSYIITCAADEHVYAKYATIFDKSAKTFTLHK